MHRCSWLLLAFAVSASAADDPGIFDCRAVADDHERLRCYDALVDRLLGAPASVPRVASSVAAEVDAVPAARPAVRPPDEQKRSLRERLFGRSEESRQVVEQVFGVEGLDEQAERVVSVGRNAYGRLVVRLGNGQIWTQVDNQALSLEPGDEVVVRSAILGSFQLQKAEGSRRIRVRRTD